MASVILLKIESLQVRVIPDTGLRLRYRGQEFSTGMMIAQLDDGAVGPVNMGMVDLASGAILLRWAVLVSIPSLADAVAAGSIDPEHCGPVRVSIEESGQVLPDGSGFNMKGTGRFEPGSLLSPAIILPHPNGMVLQRGGRARTLVRALGAGGPVPCVFVPERCHMDFALPKSLGGDTQRLNLAGGFSLRPITTLRTPRKGSRGRS